MTQLHDIEWLVYIERGELGKEYWVLHNKGVSPLFTKHKVPKRFVDIAIVMFEDHKDGIREVTMNQLTHKTGKKWNPVKFVKKIDN